MPYIPKPERGAIANKVYELAFLLDRRGPGKFNYALTELCRAYIQGNVNYATYNEVVGVLECVKQEFYRRAVAGYEDKKIEENGDVY